MRGLSLVGLVGCLTVACSASTDTKAAEQQVSVFHRQLDAGRFDQIYRGGTDDFRKSASRNDMGKFLSAIHRKLRASKSTELRGWRVSTTTSGAFTELDYATVYEHGPAKETFNYKSEGGKPVLAGYNINSPALVLN